MYRIIVTAQAKKEFNILKTVYQEAIGAALQDIKENPFIGKPLMREFSGKFSYKISVFRIIYKVKVKDKIIQVITAGHRSKVYK